MNVGRNLQNVFCQISKTCSMFETQTRNMSRIKTRFTMAPFWQPKKTRVLYPENFTSENIEYLNKEAAERMMESPLKAELFEKGKWRPGSFRCGLIARKIGVYPMWTKDGKRMLSTILHVCDNEVVKYIPPEEMEKHDFRYKNRVRKTYLAGLVIGAISSDPRLFTKEYLSLFQESGVVPKARLTKFYITPNAKLAPGTRLFASHFRPGDFVDVHGVTMDRGFQGVMKRWNFHGGPATHGVTKSHRRPGNIGGGGKIARVWPGTKMPGHMGRHHRMLRGQEILRVNTELNLIWVRGPAISGETGNLVLLYDSILPKSKITQSEESHRPFPTFYQEEEEIERELFHPKLHDFSSPSIHYEDIPK